MGANLSKALGMHYCQYFPGSQSNRMGAAGKIFGNKEMRLLMLGLDAAGKTSVFCTSPLCSADATR